MVTIMPRAARGAPAPRRGGVSLSPRRSRLRSHARAPLRPPRRGQPRARARATRRTCDHNWMHALHARPSVIVSMRQVPRPITLILVASTFATITTTLTPLTHHLVPALREALLLLLPPLLALPLELRLILQDVWRNAQILIVKLATFLKPWWRRARSSSTYSPSSSRSGVGTWPCSNIRCTRVSSVSLPRNRVTSLLGSSGHTSSTCIARCSL